MPFDKEILILLVDDSKGTRNIVTKILRNLGFENVDEAEDGQVAMEMMEDEDYDLVISDWFMPNMTGLEMVQAMRLNPEQKDTPVLLVTGEEDQEAIMLALKSGATNYMVKPYNAKILAEKIQKIFDFQEKKKQRKP